MYYLMFHCKPKPDAGDIEGVGGAYINCYVVAKDLLNATKTARRDIRKMKMEDFISRRSI